MSLEQDIIRIRQKLTYLEQHGGGGGEGTDGKSLWVTYHTADHIGSPPNPTGDGSTGGWSTTASENSGWMSTKLAYTITEGQWSDPIRIRGYDGSPGTFYYIKPVNGTAIKNHTGTLTIEARKLEGGTDSLLGNGSIQLYYLDSVPETPVWKLVHTSNGFQAGSNGFTGVLNSDNISGSIVIVLKDGVDGTPLDTITLVDVADGLPGPEGEPGSDGEPGTPGSPGAPGQDGINAIVGSVTSDRGLVFARAKNSGVWTPAETTTKLTVTYYQGGGVLAARDLVITRTDGTLSAPTPSSVDGITYTRIGNDTAALTIEFQHVASGIKAAETVYVTQGGDKGDTGDQGPKGDDGEDGEDGKTYGAVSDDVPELTGVRFVINGVNIAWNGGKVEYKGVEYTLASNTTGFNNDYVYLDMADTIADGTNAILKGDEDLDVATDISGSNHWLVCKRDGGKAYPASPFKIVTATAIQAGSLSAVSANLGGVLAGEIKLSGENGSETTEVKARYQLKINAGGIQGRWRGSGKPAWSDTASGTPGQSTYNSGWRKILDITNNEVKLSFDSYNSGENIAGLGNLSNVSENTALGYGDLLQDGSSKTISVFSLSNASTLSGTLRAWFSQPSINSNSWVDIEVRRVSDNQLMGTIGRTASGGGGAVTVTGSVSGLAANTLYKVTAEAYSQNLTGDYAGYEFSSYSTFNQAIKKS